MPGWLVLAVVMLAFALIAFAWWAIDWRRRKKYAVVYDAWRAQADPSAGTPQDRAYGSPQVGVPRPPTIAPFTGWAALALGVLTAVFVLVSAYNPVGTKEVGVETSFGRTAGHLDNGPHLTWPWIYVHPMDGAVQTDNYGGPKNAGASANYPCIQVRLANQQTGCAQLSFQWRIRSTAVDELYKDYRSFEHVRNAVVSRRLTAAVNEALASYNPLATIAAGQSIKSQLPNYAKDISRIMRREVGGQIKVLSTIMPIIVFDPSTQNRINQLQQQVAQTAIAKQEYHTNVAKATANAALATKSLDELVLVSRCLDTFGEMVKESQNVPAGFSCWPGGSSPVSVLASPTKK